MKKTKNFFIYKNKIILANGSSVKIFSNKYIKNYYSNLKSYNQIKTILSTNKKNTKQLNFMKNIF